MKERMKERVFPRNINVKRDRRRIDQPLRRKNEMAGGREYLIRIEALPPSLSFSPAFDVSQESKE